VSRADFRFDDRTLDGVTSFFIEVDIQPGMTETRLCRSSQCLRA
jgi:D-alanine-D-alanine ligase-like ATP-grasp enzyme